MEAAARKRNIVQYSQQFKLSGGHDTGHKQYFIVAEPTKQLFPAGQTLWRQPTSSSKVTASPKMWEFVKLHKQLLVNVNHRNTLDRSRFTTSDNATLLQRTEDVSHHLKSTQINDSCT